MAALIPAQLGWPVCWPSHLRRHELNQLGVILHQVCSCACRHAYPCRPSRVGERLTAVVPVSSASGLTRRSWWPSWRLYSRYSGPSLCVASSIDPHRRKRSFWQPEPFPYVVGTKLPFLLPRETNQNHWRTAVADILVTLSTWRKLLHALFKVFSTSPLCQIALSSDPAFLSGALALLNAVALLPIHSKVMKINPVSDWMALLAAKRLSWFLMPLL